MRQFYILVFLVLAGCENEDIFRPDAKYIYSPSWKVWEIRYIDEAGEPGHNYIRSRDLKTRFVFTDSVLYWSHDEGETFIKYTTNHISMDSISYTSRDSLPERESYIVRDMFVSGDAFPEIDSLRMIRDEMFPQIEGKLLFLQLENKKKAVIENLEHTEILMLYN